MSAQPAETRTCEQRETASEYRAPHVSVRGWIGLSLLAFLTALFIRAFFFQTYSIPSESMYPTLWVGDHIVVNKLLFATNAGRVLGGRDPQRGEVVVFTRNIDDSVQHFIKRIVAVPGDSVRLAQGRVFVNGKVLPGKSDKELAILTGSAGTSKTLGLTDGEYFALGDNYSNSFDSRMFGPISRGQIVGRAEFIYWSWEGIRKPWSLRWKRVGLWIP